MSAAGGRLHLQLDSSHQKKWQGRGNIRKYEGTVVAIQGLLKGKILLLFLPKYGWGDAALLANFDKKVHKPQSKSYGRIGANMQLFFTHIL